MRQCPGPPATLLSILTGPSGHPPTRIPEPAAVRIGLGSGVGGEGGGASRQVPTPPTKVSGAVIRIFHEILIYLC